MFQSFCLYMSIVSMCNYNLHSVTDIHVRVPPVVPIQPKTFRFPNVYSTLRILSKEVFSRRGSTVVRMKRKIPKPKPR